VRRRVECGGGTLQDEFIEEFDKAAEYKPSSNNRDFNPLNNRVTIRNLSNKFIEKGLSAVEQQEILIRVLKPKFNKIEIGNTTAADLLMTKYHIMGVHIDNLKVDELIKTHRK